MKTIARFFRWLGDLLDPPLSIAPSPVCYGGSPVDLARAIEERLPAGIVAEYRMRRGSGVPLGCVRITFEGP
jgi:hypothetical protein